MRMKRVGEKTGTASQTLGEETKKRKPDLAVGILN